MEVEYISKDANGQITSRVKASLLHILYTNRQQYMYISHIHPLQKKHNYVYVAMYNIFYSEHIQMRCKCPFSTEAANVPFATNKRCPVCTLSRKWLQQTAFGYHIRTFFTYRGFSKEIYIYYYLYI